MSTHVIQCHLTGLTTDWDVERIILIRHGHATHASIEDWDQRARPGLQQIVLAIATLDHRCTIAASADCPTDLATTAHRPTSERQLAHALYGKLQEARREVLQVKSWAKLFPDPSDTERWSALLEASTRDGQLFVRLRPEVSVDLTLNGRRLTSTVTAQLIVHAGLAIDKQTVTQAVAPDWMHWSTLEVSQHPKYRELKDDVFSGRVLGMAPNQAAAWVDDHLKLINLLEMQAADFARATEAEREWVLGQSRAFLKARFWETLATVLTNAGRQDHYVFACDQGRALRSFGARPRAS